MSKLNCPHCGKQGVSTFRKMVLGPGKPTTCKACGKNLGVPYTALLAIIPFLAAIVASAFVESVVLKATLWIGGFIVSSIIHVFWIPLEPG